MVSLERGDAGGDIGVVTSSARGGDGVRTKRGGVATAGGGECSCLMRFVDGADTAHARIR